MHRFIATIGKSLSSVPVLLTCVFVLVSSPTVASTPLPFDPDKITPDSISLTAKQFFKSYTSDDAEERKHAELYLLGVMDASEGKAWCDYRTFKTITLRGRIFEEFKRLDRSRFNERASKVIEDILSQRYPCGGKQ
jgi:Rap1a immunity proteins